MQAAAPAASKRREAGGEAALRVAVAAHVEHRQRARVEGVVIHRVHVSDVADVGGHRFVVPAVAAEQEATVGHGAGGLEEELVDARLAVGDAVREEREIGDEAGLGRGLEVGVGIERVVDGDAEAGAERLVAAHHRIAAAVGEHHVVAGDEGAERIGRVVARAVERGGRVDVPEHHLVVRALVREHARLEELVEDAHAARLDDHVRAPGLLERAQGGALVGAGVDDHPGPGRIGDVAVLLPIERVGLVEGDAVAARGERPEDAAVVGGRAVPVGRDQARPEEGDCQRSSIHVGARWGKGERGEMVAFQAALAARRGSARRTSP
jgi:hypothetical protein